MPRGRCRPSLRWLYAEALTTSPSVLLKDKARGREDMEGWGRGSDKGKGRTVSDFLLVHPYTYIYPSCSVLP